MSSDMEESDINKISELIYQVNEMLDNEMMSIQEFLSSYDLKSICNRYEENKNELDEVGFSIFKIVSELYYHEKFHSQIIATLLNPKEKHLEENKFLVRFLNYLNDKHEAKINVRDYQNAEVTGTKDIGEIKYIDIWIQGNGIPKHCVIIENKIKDADDQFLQIPRYVDVAKKEGYIVDAIIYLSLNGKKTNTDENNWTEKNLKDNNLTEVIIQEIRTKLIPIAAYNNEDGKEKDLHHGWIIPCSNVANNIDALLILRQYGKLLKSLNKTTMSDLIMEKFFNTIYPENFQVALSIKSLIEALPPFLAKRLANSFEQKLHDSPFQSVNAQNDTCMFRGFKWNESIIVADIKTGLINKVVVQFYDSTYYDNGGTKDNAFDILNLIGYHKEFSPTHDNKNKDWYQRIFEFPSGEKDMLDFVDGFNKKLKEFSEESHQNV